MGAEMIPLGESSFSNSPVGTVINLVPVFHWSLDFSELDLPCSGGVDYDFVFDIVFVLK